MSCGVSHPHVDAPGVVCLWFAEWPCAATHMLVRMHQLVHAVAQPQELSILNDPKEQKKGQTSGQNPNAGWYNRFVQSGKSDHETKTNGCFGGRVYAYVSQAASHRRLLPPVTFCCHPCECVLCMHTGPCTGLSQSVYRSLSIYIYMYTHIYMHMCTYTCICVHVCM